MEILGLIITVLIFLLFISTLFTYYSISISMISFYLYLRNKHPEIRNNLGPIKGVKFLFSSVSGTTLNSESVVTRILKTYSDTFRIFRSFGNRKEIERVYENLVDLKAVRATADVVLLQKWESLISSMSIFIRLLTLVLLALFSGTIIYYLCKGLGYLI